MKFKSLEDQLYMIKRGVDEILPENQLVEKIEKSLSRCQGSYSKQWTNCKGTYTTENGYKYVGKFKDGKILIGTATYPGGARYAGKFKNYKVWTLCM